MNKHDFYKELMSEYSFDAEKIRTNAKNGKYAKQKISPFTIGITAAVAAVTVTCGTLAMTTLDDRNGVDLVGNNPSLSALSYSERVQNAIEMQNNARNSDEITDIMVTFISPLAPRQAENIIAAHTDGNVPVKAVYLADGSKISGSAEVAAVFNGSSAISAMCIECKGSVMALLQSDPDVCLVEPLSETDLNTATPINPDDVDTLEIALPDSTAPENVEQSVAVPPVNDAPVVVPAPEETTDAVSVPTEEADTTEVIDIVETLEPIETTEATSETDATIEVPTETVQSPEIVETIESIENNNTKETAEAIVPVVPIETVDPVAVDMLPDGVVLPTTPESFSYETAYLDADSAYFISNNTFFVRSDYGFAIYSYFGEKEQLIEKIECSNPKVQWIAENGDKLIVSASADEDAGRNKLWLVNASAQSIVDLHIDDIVMDGSLADVGYNAEYRTLTAVIKEYGTYYTYVMALNNDNSLAFSTSCFTTTAKTGLLGYNAGTVYLAVSDGSLSQIYAVDANNGSSRIIKTFSDNPKFSKNLAFTHGIVAPSDSAVTGSVLLFDPATESFIDTGYFDNNVVFGASKHSFGLNGYYYTIANGELTPAGGINSIAAVDYKKSLSASYAAYADKGYVTITESIYSNTNKQAVLDFGHITSSGDAVFRDALNGAIGANNALALSLCRESGMYKPELLTKTLRVYYSENALAQLKTLCNIADYGTLSYTSGGLNAISAASTELVISTVSDTSASGTMYVKAGSFGGKTAYRSVNVSFVYENGSWKLDTIIGK